MKPKACICLSLLGLSLLALPAVRRPALPSRSTHRGASSLLLPAPPVTPFERSLRQAWHLRMRAWDVADRDRYQLEEWGPGLLEGTHPEGLRRQLLARDRGGYLRRARSAGRRAAALARTPAEASRAAALLARVEGELGCHSAELQQARRLMALAPPSPRSLQALRQAETCNGERAIRLAPEIPVSPGASSPLWEGGPPPRPGIGAARRAPAPARRASRPAG
jgi:hypothetical protein